VIFNPGLGPKAGLNQSKERRNRYAQFPPFWRRLLKDSITWDLSVERYDETSTPLLNFARPPALVVCGGGASGRPQPDPLARWPAPVIAVRRARAAGGLRDCRDRPGRRDPACTFRPLRDLAVTA
jgi:hypothetical protein